MITIILKSDRYISFTTSNEQETLKTIIADIDGGEKTSLTIYSGNDIKAYIRVSEIAIVSISPDESSP